MSNACSSRGLRGPRSPEDIDAENEILADLIQAQEDIYTNKRTKRSTLPTIERNVLLVVDSSGSIGSSTYQRVINVLAEFASLFCGEVGIGMVGFSYIIDLEFCPNCLRRLKETTYRQIVVNKIKSARYHHGWATKTGETVKCLSEEILPSPDCVFTTTPTQLVFFTDGRANGCINPKSAIQSLMSKYPNLETYAIGMGDIKDSGITDLLSDKFDPYNVFNVNNITEFEEILAIVKANIYSGNINCAPVSY